MHCIIDFSILDFCIFNYRVNALHQLTLNPIIATLHYKLKRKLNYLKMTACPLITNKAITIW